MDIKKHLNYALVEDSRPPMYKAMKYWGKKPHNIWKEFIECYCPENGVVLDPFVGSGVAAFESVVSNRKVIAFDINPMSSFFIEVSTAGFNADLFTASANRIIQEIKNDPVYQQHYCKKDSGKRYSVYNYIWKDGTVWKINAKDDNNNQVLLYPDKSDLNNADSMDNLTIPFWYPKDLFPNTPSINGKFIKEIGGNNFSFLWTKRNLYILSYIFERIKEQAREVQLPLLFAFVHTLHLVSKMVVSRQEKGNRSFSGSWGRADYMIRNRRMEQNPLVVFERACFDKQGVVSALTNAKERLSTPVRTNEVKRGNGIKAKAVINYGTVDVADILDYIPEKSVDFVITDPPYGGLVQYLDLSLIWLVWLQNYDKKYTPDLNSEITVKRGIVTRDIYKRRLQNAFVNIHKVLKDDGYLVITFHNKEMEEWNDFVNAVRNAGFKFDKVTHQYNRRSGESNVSNPYGTAGSDFYIRCVKKRDVDFSNDRSALEHFIYQKTVDVIARRAEPTPYDFILNGVLPELLQAGYLQPEEPAKEINKVLLNYVGDDRVFKVTDNPDNKGGTIWWFNDPPKHINYSAIPLSDRVDKTVLSILRRRLSVKLDDVIAELFKMYPDGLTPDPRKIREVLEKYAYQSAGKWKLKDVITVEATKHTEMISQLCHIASKAGIYTYVGRREQPEHLGNGQQLKDLTDYDDISFLREKYDDSRIERISWIDCLYFNTSKDLIALFEVENSTNFTSALMRASNIEADIPKWMIIPDSREDELLSYQDPRFQEIFSSENWSYLTYTEINRIAAMRRCSISDLVEISHKIN